VGQLGSIEVGLWGSTDVGVARTNNEDCFSLFDLSEGADLTTSSFVEVGPKGILLTVSDGMGGENAGEVASAITVASMREYVQAGLHEDVGEALAASVVHANTRVTEAAVAPERAGMGAAVVSVLLHDGVAHVTEVGDCRAYLLRDGALLQLTRDQTHVQVLIDQGLMTPEAAKKSRAKSVVLQAVGKTEDLSVTQRTLTLREGDRLLLCSDGLTVNVTDPEIAEKLAGQLDGAVEALIALANQRGGVDNVTVVIVEVTGALAPSHPEEKVQDTLKTIREFEIGGGSSS
jgi:serine/threonine protein phosphatase PrpC